MSLHTTARQDSSDKFILDHNSHRNKAYHLITVETKEKYRKTLKTFLECRKDFHTLTSTDPTWVATISKRHCKLFPTFRLSSVVVCTTSWYL